ncbi:BatA domain-containing protein [Colwelliaceae bacterium BS250]
MFSVVTPILLLGFCCLVIPILIHLFNKSRGRLVEIGSIELLRKLNTSQVSEIKLRRLLLLALRLLIFSLATLIIAQLFIKSDFLKSSKSLHLVSQAWLNNANNTDLEVLFKQQQDNKNIELITDDFPTLTSPESVVISRDALNNESNKKNENIKIWPLLLDRIAKTEQQAIHIYLANTLAVTDLAALNNLKPSLAKEVIWHVKTLAKPAVAVAQKPFQVGIYWQQSRDIAYLKSALALIKEHQYSGLELTLINSKSKSQQFPDITLDALFYLSDETVSADLLKKVQQGMLLIRDATDSEVKTGYWQVLGNSSLLTTALIYQYSAIDNQDNIANNYLFPQQWSLSNGALLLSTENIGKGKYLKFASRFEDGWSNITTQAQFPAILLSLLAVQQNFNEFNQLTLAPGQMQLPANKAIDQTITGDVRQHSLFKLCAILLVLAWLLERFISERYYHGRR